MCPAREFVGLSDHKKPPILSFRLHCGAQLALILAHITQVFPGVPQVTELYIYFTLNQDFNLEKVQKHVICPPLVTPASKSAEGSCFHVAGVCIVG